MEQDVIVFGEEHPNNKVQLVEEFRSVMETNQETETPISDSGVNSPSDPSNGAGAAANVHIAKSSLPRATRYSLTDIGPFFVLVKFIDKDVRNFHPLKVERWFYKQEYQVLHLHKSGFNQLEVHFKTPEQANKFLDSDFDLQHNAQSFIPFYNLYSTGLIRVVDIDISVEEISEYIKTSGQGRCSQLIGLLEPLKMKGSLKECPLEP